MSKRQKLVHDADNIGHLWFHKTQSEARNAGKNYYFEGDTIFSYGSHFPIAKHVTNKSGRKSAVLFTVRSYSVTTSKHLSLTRRAIPHGTTVFYVPRVLATYEREHEDNLAYFANEALEALNKSKNSRASGLSLLNSAYGYRETAKQYATFFRIKFNSKAFAFLPKGEVKHKLVRSANERLERYCVADAAREAKAKIRRDAHNAKWQAQWDEQARINALASEEKMNLWRNGELASSMLPYDLPTMLRIEGEELVTSRGARVPVTHAIKALELIRKVKARGIEFVTNGHTCHVGAYKIDRVTVAGDVFAGCHHILFDEIDRIAPTIDAIALASIVDGAKLSDAE